MRKSLLLHCAPHWVQENEAGTTWYHTLLMCSTVACIRTTNFRRPATRYCAEPEHTSRTRCSLLHYPIPAARPPLDECAPRSSASSRHNYSTS